MLYDHHTPAELESGDRIHSPPPRHPAAVALALLLISICAWHCAHAINGLLRVRQKASPRPLDRGNESACCRRADANVQSTRSLPETTSECDRPTATLFKNPNFKTSRGITHRLHFTGTSENPQPTKCKAKDYVRDDPFAQCDRAAVAISPMCQRDAPR